MSDQTIRCPNCGTKIPVTEALFAPVKESVRKEFEAKARERDDELRKKEEELSKKLAGVEAARRSIERDVEARLTAERAKLRDEAVRKAKEEMETRLRDLEEDRREKERLLNEARIAELELRKKARALEEEKKDLDLKVARTLDAERERIRQSAIEAFTEEHRLKDAEKEKKISDMQRIIDELKRKAEQGSMQAQGEVLELDIESLLRTRFPVDTVEPVPKGLRGADIIQKVYTKTGQYCGSIVWESKRTKAWNDEWITKLKDDQREVRADTAVLVTEAMPKGIASFGLYEGVWVTSVALAGGLAEALRAGLTQVAQSRVSAMGKGEKMEAIYNYLSGQEFRQRVEAIVETYRSMREDLDREKNAMYRLWAKREKHIERVRANISCMFGDLQGIIGAGLPEIKSLELPEGVPSEGEEQDI